MYLKVMKEENRKIVAVCDKELLGNVYGAEDAVLDLEAHREFYEGELSTEEDVKNHLKDADSINLVGERAVGIGLDMGLIEDKHIKKIAGIPHAQIYRIDL